jgi:exosortase/archaeosortase family protein
MIAWYATVPSHQSQVSSFKFQIGRSFVLLFVAWAFVNGVNSMRVVLSFWTRLASEAMLPERFDAAVHMVSGVMIFFPALLCVWWLCETKPNEVFNERKN